MERFWSYNTTQIFFMKQYRLLRSNKESGPYSAEELIAMGLKAYDLIWIEGRSAAWRYPSEIEALKDFAPPVEEQPFDRFYKKTKEPLIAQDAIEEKIQIPQNKKPKPKIKIKADLRKVETKKPEIVVPDNLTKSKHSEETLAWQDVWLDWEQEKKAASESSKKKLNTAAYKTEEPVLETKYSASLDDIKNQYIENVLQAKNNKNKIQINISPNFKMAAVLLGVVLAGGFWMGAKWMHDSDKDIAHNISSSGTTQNTQTPEQDNAITNETGNNFSNTIEKSKQAPAHNDNQVTFITVTKKDKQPRKPGTKQSETALPADDINSNTEISSNNSEEDFNERPTHKRGEETTAPAKNFSSEKTVNDYIKVPQSIQLSSDGADVKVNNISDVPFDMVAIDLMYYDANNQYKKGETVYIKNLQPGKSMVVKAPGDNASVTIKPRVSIISSDAKNIYLSGE